RCMHDVQHTNLVFHDFIYKHVTGMDDQLLSTWSTARPPAVGMIQQQRGLVGKQRIKPQGRQRIFRLYVIVNVITVLYCLWRPNQLHHFAVAKRARVAARRAANLASTSASGMRFPASAEARDCSTLVISQSS